VAWDSMHCWVMLISYSGIQIHGSQYHPAEELRKYGQREFDSVERGKLYCDACGEGRVCDEVSIQWCEGVNFWFELLSLAARRIPYQLIHSSLVKLD